MSTSPFDDWDGSVRHAKRLQGELAARVVLVGHHAESGIARGKHVPLEHEGEQIGWMLRSRDGVRRRWCRPGNACR
ncbi:endonuclease V [Metapseudomonas otitidis]|uniref:endonuclease V n=1 Tax=Metapseudomonas otitidis TaxID=319939 RepID=UPI0013F657A9|nr:endonuclease V [Pseudomonas otitidis]